MMADAGKEQPSSAAKAALKTVSRIGDIEAAAWDACANPWPATFDPFVSHGFLKALEESKSVGGRTGWSPRHLVFEEGEGELVACAPCYAKTHSQGEYVFDHAWADAYERAGGRYYPKLQIAVPFTPVPGGRLLVKAGSDAVARFARLADGAVALASGSGASSLHVTFQRRGEWEALGALGFLRRTGLQFHWHNQGYATFGDFLDALASRKRKSIRKERAEALSGGLNIELRRGAEIKETHWDTFFRFYMDTGARKWGRPYLNRLFFSLLGQAMAERCLLVLAKRGGRYIAGALNLIGGDCLYGRYWGAIEDHRCLHFEVCYYQAIEYAIANELSRVEAGAQGEHKLARGYRPVETYSAHWIAHPGLRDAVARYLIEERREISEAIRALSATGPYRHDDKKTEPLTHG